MTLELCAQEFGLRVQRERTLHRGRVAAQSMPSLSLHKMSSGQHETRWYDSVINRFRNLSQKSIVAKIIYYCA